MCHLDTRPHEVSPALYYAEKVSRASVFKELQIISLPGALPRLGPALPSTVLRSILGPTPSTKKRVTRATSRLQTGLLSFVYRQFRVHVGAVKAAVGLFFCGHDNEPPSSTDYGGFLE
jgi:hypothetical protein